MNILIIDTATNIEYIGASIRGQKAEKSVKMEKTHAAMLFNTIDDVLTSAGGSIRDIDLIATGIGPGSFTGIRIAVTTARMLAQITGASLMGVYSQELFARSAPLQENGFLLIAFDAKKNRVFGALYTIQKGEMTALAEPGDYPIEELLALIPSGAMVLTAGDGINRFSEKVSESIKTGKHLEELVPKIEKLEDVIKDIYRENPEKFSKVNNVVPCYARKSDAEIAKKTKKINGCP